MSDGYEPREGSRGWAYIVVKTLDTTINLESRAVEETSYPRQHQPSLLLLVSSATIRSDSLINKLSRAALSKGQVSFLTATTGAEDEAILRVKLVTKGRGEMLLERRADINAADVVVALLCEEKPSFESGGGRWR